MFHAGSNCRCLIGEPRNVHLGGSVVPFPALNYFGPGPQTFGPGITWFSSNVSNNGGSAFGYTGNYGFGSDGFWKLDMAALNDSFDTFGASDTMTFEFANPLSAGGGFLNYTPGGSTPTTIAVYDSSGSLIESDTFDFPHGRGQKHTGQFSERRKALLGF